MGPSLLALHDLHVAFDTNDGVVEAVKGVDLAVSRGEVVAVVGESGSGKSQMMMAVMGLLASNGRATGGVAFDGGAPADIAGEPLKALRGNAVTMIFQEPMTSLDPLYRIGDQMAAVIRRHSSLDKPAALKRAEELLGLVKIPNPGQRLQSYPHELSGGQRQRVMIAMALANRPDLLIADEPTTALDVTIQAQVLEVLAALQRERGMSILLITHDLGIVAGMAHRVAVMYAGEIVEVAERKAFYRAPQHPYARKLFAALPGGRKRGQPLATIPGAVPDLAGDFAGCRFAERCELATGRCRRSTSIPGPTWGSPRRRAPCRCWRCAT